jgi:hypothetical protein
MLKNGVKPHSSGRREEEKGKRKLLESYKGKKLIYRRVRKVSQGRA